MYEQLKPHLIMILVVTIGVIAAAWVMAYIKPLNPSDSAKPSSDNQMKSFMGDEEQYMTA